MGNIFLILGFLQNLPTNVVICEQREIFKFCNIILFQYFLFESLLI